MISPRKLLQDQGLRARKRLGQNFLTSPAIAARIVDQAAITPADPVLEIGAGLGALTVPAARHARHVLAVDKDPRLFDSLQSALAAHDIQNVTPIQADFLKWPLDRHLPADGSKWIVLGNLPYNISSQIIVRLIRYRDRLQRAVLMLQREMADRLLAAPGGREYGRLSVMLQYAAKLRKVIDVDAIHFFPRPQVSSAVIEARFHLRPPVIAANDELLFRVVKAAFGQRRKTLRNALRGSSLRLTPETVDVWLAAESIDPRRRAETLSVAEFVGLSNWLHRHMSSSH